MNMEMRVGYRYVMAAGMMMFIVAAFLMMSSLSGCALFGNGGLSPEKPGYEEGRVVAFANVSMEGVQPEKVNLALHDGWLVIRAIVLAGNDPTEELVKAQIAIMFPDSTPQYRQAVFNFYSMARTKLEQDLGKHGSVPTPVLVRNFVEGIDAGLRDYKAGYAEQFPKE